LIRRTPLRTLPIAAFAATVAVPACGSDTKVGSEEVTDFEDQAQKRLGETTTTKKKTTTTVNGASGTTATTATQVTQQTTSTTSQSAIATVTIQGDLQGDAFKPRVQPVYVGGIVKWINRDTKSHVVKARRGEFKSPPIPPGGSWEYTVTLSPGEYEYTDDRPYAVGYLQVIAR
jgi:plastocyanin